MWIKSKGLLLLPAGHAKEVVDLAGSPARAGLLASLARDGNLRLWDAGSGGCLASHDSDATCLVRFAAVSWADATHTARGHLGVCYHRHGVPCLHGSQSHSAHDILTQAASVSVLIPTQKLHMIHGTARLHESCKFLCVSGSLSSG